jgi:hypothetical protein
MVLGRRHVRWQTHSGCDFCEDSRKTRIVGRFSVFPLRPAYPDAGTFDSASLSKRNSGALTVGRTRGPSQAVQGPLSLFFFPNKIWALDREDPWAERREAPLPREE